MENWQHTSEPLGATPNGGHGLPGEPRCARSGAMRLRPARRVDGCDVAGVSPGAAPRAPSPSPERDICQNRWVEPIPAAGVPRSSFGELFSGPLRCLSGSRSPANRPAAPARRRLQSPSGLDPWELVLNINTYAFASALMLLSAVLLPPAAAAQRAEDCPLPPGATDFPRPAVTAQDVAGGVGSLMDFTLAVTAVTKEVSQEATTNRGPVFHLGCLVRQEGGYWRSGSIYTFKLTTGGRVLSHAKEMAISGGLLDRRIYASVLTALGASPTDVENLWSSDAAAAARARDAVQDVLRQEPHAAFDAALPGVSGYAAVYISGFGSPILMIAGFDMMASHLEPEALDYGDPAIAASEVVDRATLQAFVNEAGRYWVSLRETSDPDAVSKGKIVFRDENGPWRHGDVYLYVLDTRSNNILIHAAFPDRFELRPLVATVRDVVTGELVLPQVLEAASSSPEGGFVEYFWDDPSDDSDRADIPKVGFAREFTAHVPRGGTTIPVKYVIGSGIYLNSPTVTAARQNTVIETVLPQVMRAMTASTVDAVSSRIEQAVTGTAPAAGLNLGGAATLSDVLLAHGQALGTGSFDLGRLLANSSFTVPLDATGDGGPLANLTLWGSGDYRSFSGGSSDTLTYDGDVVSANVGVDTRLAADLYAGVSVGQGRGAVDYTGLETLTGETTTTLTSINPYVGWQAQTGLSVWATAGYGWGEVEVDDPADDVRASDLTQRMVAAGASGPLVTSDQLIDGGTTSLRLKGEAAFTWADVEGAGSIDAVDLEASRQRLMVEGRHVRSLASGATLTPSVEMGMRHDGGDGDTGHRLEIGGGLRYADPATGLTVEGRARTVPVQSGEYQEWGVSGMVRLDPGAAGTGLALSVQPAWGRAASGVERLWATDQPWGAAPADQAAGRLNARIAYGIGAGWGGRGVLTPYADVALSGEGTRRLGLGGQFRLGTAGRLILETVESRPVSDRTARSIVLRGNLLW